MTISDKNPFLWQKECLEKWIQNQGRGIVNVVTGAGKTFLALTAIAKLSESMTLLGNTDLTVKIIVPKTFLVNQWAEALKSELHIPASQIGYYYGRHKDLSEKKYMIYVINSARYSISRHIMQDFQNGRSVMLIADECHHYGSDENFRIFDFFPYINKLTGKFFSLGLSATPQVPDNNHSLEPFLGKEIFHYGFSNALHSNIISSFSTFRIGVDFSEDELEEYDSVSYEITLCYARLVRLCPQLKKAGDKLFFAMLNKLTSHDKSNIAVLSRSLLILFYRRKEILHLAKARLDCVVELIGRLNENAKIIVFGERIETANLLYERLNRIYQGQVGRYHSKMSEQTKKTALDQYRSAEIRILISCKALDEGLNIPQTDIGIILSETSNARQRIQRLGRILRKSEEIHTAKLYSIFINQIQGTDTFDQYDEANTVTLCFDSLHKDFFSEQYDKLCQKVLSSFENKDTDTAILVQLKHNMHLGVVNDDFLLSKSECLTKIDACASKRERNYWITMLLIIKARSGEL